MITCKRLTNSLPKLSLLTPPPPETAGYQVGRVYGRTCQHPIKRFHFLGVPGRVFFKFDMHGESLKKFIMCGGWRDSNPRPRRKHGSVDDAICQGISGVLVRLTTCCNRLTNSLPKLNRIPHIDSNTVGSLGISFVLKSVTRATIEVYLFLAITFSE